MIKLVNVSKSFSQFKVIKSVSLMINKGEVYGTIGASGAGKSTLLRLVIAVQCPRGTLPLSAVQSMPQMEIQSR